MEVFTLSIESIKKKVEELSELQKNGKPGYACGWTDACGMILAILDKETDGVTIRDTTRGGHHVSEISEN